LDQWEVVKPWVGTDRELEKLANKSGCVCVWLLCVQESEGVLGLKREQEMSTSAVDGSVENRDGTLDRDADLILPWSQWCSWGTWDLGGVVEWSEVQSLMLKCFWRGFDSRRKGRAQSVNHSIARFQSLQYLRNLAGMTLTLQF
jgi:hypothetical protein